MCTSNDDTVGSLYLRRLAWALAAGQCDEYRKFKCFLNNISLSSDTNESTSIIHRECNKGFEYFKEDMGDFYWTDYIPWSAYVPNYKLKPTLTSTTQSKPTTQSTTVTEATPTTQATPTTHVTSTLQASAPPLPSKTGLPEPMVIVPACHQYSLQPSAPPIDLVLPSYEEAMAELPAFTKEVKTF